MSGIHFISTTPDDEKWSGVSTPDRSDNYLYETAYCRAAATVPASAFPVRVITRGMRKSLGFAEAFRSQLQVAVASAKPPVRIDGSPEVSSTGLLKYFSRCQCLPKAPLPGDLITDKH
ncbi:hypothetical protein KCP77_20525 [Salmonella enterica subsp. enterica]|nr:hypothetical protein KCP77_20525 [Salmonella enterica subsp. enterica]